MAEEVGTYVLPVIASFEGIDKQVNSKLSKAFGATGKNVGADLAKGAAEGMKALEAEVKKSSDAIAKLRDKEAAAADKVATAEARIEEVRQKGGSALKRAEAQRNAADRARLASLREIEKQTRLLEQAQGSLNDAQAEAARGGERSGAGFLAGMRGSLSSAGSVGSEAASSFAEGFAGSSALLRLGGAGGPVGLALAAAGTVAGGLLVQNVLAGVEREPGRDLIQARLRLDDASMAEVARSAAKAYVNNFGDSVQSNLDAGQLAIQGGLVSGALDPDLNNVIEKLQAINQYVDGDLAQTTKSASVLLRSGLAGSAEEAFDVIAAGYAMTGDLGGDFLDSIGEYSSGWKNAGLNATQALALIKQGSELGVDVTDRSADALREFGRRVSENGDDIVAVLNNIGLDGESMFAKFKQGGEAGFEAFDQVFDRIRAIEDPTRRNQAAMALLGDTAGDFIGAFTQWDPSAAVAKFGSVEGAAQNAADTMGNNVAGSFESAKRSIEVSLDDVQDKLADAFGPTLVDAAKSVQDHTGSIKQFFVTTGEIALSVGAEIVDTVGGITEAAGQLVGGIGNIQGTVLKFEAWQADLRGDGELADELRRQSEEAYGWGDSLEASGTSMRDLADDMRTWKDRLRDTTTNTDEAAESTSWWGESLKDTGDQADTTRGQLENLRNEAGLMPSMLVPSDGSRLPSPGFAPPAPAGGSGFQIGRLGTSLGTANASTTAPSEEQVKQIAASFGLQVTSEDRPGDPGYHGQGMALDLSNGSGNTPQMRQFAEYMSQTFGSSLKELIYSDGSFSGNIGDGKNVSGTGYYSPGTLSEHQNHVHIAADWANGSAPTAPAASPPPSIAALSAGSIPQSGGVPIIQKADGTWTSPDAAWAALIARESGGNPSIIQQIQDVNSGGNEAEGLFQITPKTWAANGGTEFAASPRLASPQDQAIVAARIFRRNPTGSDWGANLPGRENSQALAAGLNVPSFAGVDSSTAMLNNAFGPQFEPGQGTPGYNDQGEPGYYETDQRAIAQADRRAQDAQQNIADADQRIADAKAARAEIEKDLLATTEERAKADREILDAERDAQRAREDAQWAAQDAEEAKRGKFTAAKEARKNSSGSGQGGGMGLGDLGGIAGSFLKETFGFDGSFFPDISNLMPIQMLSAGLNAFAGPLQGLVDGQLGIQQPGWQPGMPVNGVANDTAIGGAAFGMPDVAVPPPPMPAPGQHPGSGAAPGPGSTVVIDQSVHGNVGSSPAELFKERDRGLARAIPRMPAIR